MTEPAHKILINRFLDWHKVENRLHQFQHIGKLFNLDELKKCSDYPPYYCHYLAWRLGTWIDDSWLTFFDNLLAQGMKLKGWDNNRINKGCEFENFWSFIWELQVAAFFVKQSNGKVEWMKSGPDLQVTKDDINFFYRMYNLSQIIWFGRIY
jgi:hypothetical protein